MTRRLQLLRHFRNYFSVHGIDLELYIQVGDGILLYDRSGGAQQPYTWSLKKYRGLSFNINGRHYYLSLNRGQMSRKNNFVLNFHKRMHGTRYSAFGPPCEPGRDGKMICPVCWFRFDYYD